MGTTPWNGQDFVFDDLDSPAVYLFWDDAQSFVTAVNSYTGKTFRLPSEAQWEYACRGGTTTRFYWGEDADYSLIGNYAWWDMNTYYAGQQYVHVVGQKLPNTFGLHDMSGNVYEWCEDDWHSNYIGAPGDGSAWKSSTVSFHMIRGGCWFHGGGTCRSAYRLWGDATFPGYMIGFRLSR
jgi:formylglycine-generating enzyme required for sulfatase activity